MAIFDRWTAVIARQDHRATLFAEMLRRFGVLDRDRAFDLADGHRLARAATTCLGCRAAARCEAWKDRQGSLAEAAEFCPNSALFRELGRTSARPRSATPEPAVAGL